VEQVGIRRRMLERCQDNDDPVQVDAGIETDSIKLGNTFDHIYLFERNTYIIHSFIPAISIAPLQVLYHSEALPTTARILYRSFTPKRTGNCR